MVHLTTAVTYSNQSQLVTSLLRSGSSHQTIFLVHISRIFHTFCVICFSLCHTLGIHGCTNSIIYWCLCRFCVTWSGIVSHNPVTIVITAKLLNAPKVTYFQHTQKCQGYRRVVHSQDMKFRVSRILLTPNTKFDILSVSQNILGLILFPELTEDTQSCCCTKKPSVKTACVYAAVGNQMISSCFRQQNTLRFDMFVGVDVV